jgi:hypothetical protein
VHSFTTPSVSLDIFLAPLKASGPMVTANVALTKQRMRRLGATQCDLPWGIYLDSVAYSQIACPIPRLVDEATDASPLVPVMYTSLCLHRVGSRDSFQLA